MPNYFKIGQGNQWLRPASATCDFCISHGTANSARSTSPAALPWPCTMPRALLSLTNNSPKSNKNFLKFHFAHNTLLYIKNTKIFQVLNELLSCTCIRSRLQLLLHKGYTIWGLNECSKDTEMAPKYNAKSAHTTTTVVSSEV